MFRGPRTTKKQKELLVCLLENQRFQLEGRTKNAIELEWFEEKWKEVAALLNNMEAARKTVKQWREVMSYFLKKFM
jgi:transketolase N-terminal domain/subunit